MSNDAEERVMAGRFRAFMAVSNECYLHEMMGTMGRIQAQPGHLMTSTHVRKLRLFELYLTSTASDELQWLGEDDDSCMDIWSMYEHFCLRGGGTSFIRITCCLRVIYPHISAGLISLANPNVNLHQTNPLRSTQKQ